LTEESEPAAEAAAAEEEEAAVVEEEEVEEEEAAEGGRELEEAADGGRELRSCFTCECCGVDGGGAAGRFRCAPPLWALACPSKLSASRAACLAAVSLATSRSMQPHCLAEAALARSLAWVAAAAASAASALALSALLRASPQLASTSRRCVLAPLAAPSNCTTARYASADCA